MSVANLIQVSYNLLRMLPTMTIQMPVYQRIVKLQASAYQIVMMTMVVRPPVSPISRKNTKTARVRYAVKIVYPCVSIEFDFQEKCPLGCPCDNYQCDLPEKKAILTLNTQSGNSPVLIQPNGKYQIFFKIKLI